MLSIVRWLCVSGLILGLIGCGELEQSVDQVTELAAPAIVEPTEAAASVISEPAPVEEAVPPVTGAAAESVLIEELVPFTHEQTGISGLQPDTWTLFPGPDSFQISSSPDAPDGFIGTLQQTDDPVTLRDEIFESLLANHPDAEGPEPEIIEDQRADDGSGQLIFMITGPEHNTSTTMIRYAGYARTIPTANGLLFTVALLPEDLFIAQEVLVREMVDSVQVAE